ncbi:SPOR domain-containing protein [Vibrio tritonius]|uniref:SPOR domain-containing protein n=1 Tax=Vibrio tritonius TaxID=1435069 RepID=A0ABS7YMF3_9VIBR|nr:SPOR domain-containing protein [Vibrio tritonius]MCA2016868.1 SPOR domain-containing protein [Vibrio tritonius]
MKKIAIVGLSALLAACASENYVTDVTSESHQEDYKVAQVSQPIVTQDGSMQGISEQNVSPRMPTTSQQPAATKTVKIVPPTAKQNAAHTRFGYTIQVVAVGSQTKVDHFSNVLPKNGQPIWENYKVVNGTKWYTVLFGDFASRTEASKAIATLPAELKKLKPFVKSIDAIKNSEFPTMNKLN